MMQSVEQRYYTDAKFHTLVDMMEKAINECQFTPSELREAAVYAAIRHEERRIQPTFPFKLHDSAGGE